MDMRRISASRWPLLQPPVLGTNIGLQAVCTQHQYSRNFPPSSPQPRTIHRAHDHSGTILPTKTLPNTDAMDATSDFDNSTIYTPKTPPSTIANFPDDDLGRNAQYRSQFWENSTATINTPPESVVAARPKDADRPVKPKPGDARVFYPRIITCLVLNVALIVFLFSCSYDVHIYPPFTPSFSLNTISAVPWQGSTFKIHSIESGKLITLLKGEVILAPPIEGGSTRWECVDTKGWLGFRSTSSREFLGYKLSGLIHCEAKKHLSWENFSVKPARNGGYILMIQHWDSLWYVGVETVGGEERLKKVQCPERAVVWKFVKVA